tara:strand:- start:1921 stop:2085 length:165 start_codon:yes stop_codon:yes gene_type:complete
MTKKYKKRKELIITDPTKFPDDFWNYWVNPIVGYYIPQKRSQTRKESRKKQLQS